VSNRKYDEMKISNGAGLAQGRALRFCAGGDRARRASLVQLVIGVAMLAPLNLHSQSSAPAQGSGQQHDAQRPRYRLPAPRAQWATD
jgi:hypothetical protein